MDYWDLTCSIFGNISVQIREGDFSVFAFVGLAEAQHAALAHHPMIGTLTVNTSKLQNTNSSSLEALPERISWHTGGSNILPRHSLDAAHSSAY